MYRVVTTRQFDEDFRQLDHDVAVRVIAKIEWLSKHPEALRFPLKHVPRDLKGLHKYRIGNHRLLLWVDEKEEILTLYAIRHRSSIYKSLK